MSCLPQTLTKLKSNKINFKYKKHKKKEFDYIKQMDDYYNLSYYPNFSKHFDIYTNASNL